MKTANLKLTKNEFGILLMAMDELFKTECHEEHSKEFWEVFDDLKYKLIMARKEISE